jgi:hypothetical protein
MGLPVVFRQAARREVIDAARTDEQQRRGMGSLFLDEVARIEAHLSDAPGLYQVVIEGVRRAVLRRFPFGVYYLEEKQRIVVLAGLDLRRDPATIASTISRRGHR